jgi:hypothetical protein
MRNLVKSNEKESTCINKNKHGAILFVVASCCVSYLYIMREGRSEERNEGKGN